MKSKLRINSLLLVLIINILAAILFINLLLKNDLLDSESWRNTSFKIAFVTVTLLEIVAIYLLSQLKEISVVKDKIVYKNIIFPFLKKERKFSDYDFSTTIDEVTKVGIFESLWLFKNGKLEAQISSFYYSNYSKLKFEIKVQNKGKLKINALKKIYYFVGGKYDSH